MAEYRGWDLDAMKAAGEHAAAQTDAYIPASSFTPINRPGAQLLTLRPLEPSPATDLPRTTSKQRVKQHNPIIAQYLGLGVEKEPPHIQKYAPALPPTPTTPPKGRKRTRKARDGSSPAEADGATKPKKAKQRRVSDNFRVTKPALRSSARKADDVTASTVSTSSPNASKNGVDPSGDTVERVVEVRQRSTEMRPVKLSSFSDPSILTQASPNYAIPSSHTLPASSRVDDLSQNTIDDEFFDDVFDSIDIGSTVDHLAMQAHRQGVQDRHSDHDHTEYRELANSSATVCGDEILPSTPCLTDDSSPLPLNGVIIEDSQTIIKGPAGATVTIPPPSTDVSGPFRKFKSPITPKTEALIRKEAMGITHRKPIVRCQFPDPVRDRSPIIGLSSNLLLRTCFRIGEAINQAARANKNGQNIMIELYARVRSSERDAVKQRFVFSDLFHDRPPYLKGEYDASIWKQVELYNYDSGRFLSKAEMCRCVGMIKRNENKEWMMVVLNIWEATWEDVDWVEGIVNS